MNNQYSISKPESVRKPNLKHGIWNLKLLMKGEMPMNKGRTPEIQNCKSMEKSGGKPKREAPFLFPQGGMMSLRGRGFG
ncbi:MAG: hypothetical protein C0397_01910 [Odoribacter sp.]|nr:hypothetical protein [Odoribacter sp.]